MTDTTIGSSDVITNRQSIDLAQWAYTVPPDLVGPIPEHPIRIHLKEVDGILYVIPEGSKTEADWRDNVRFWAQIQVPTLGDMAGWIRHGPSLVPVGFYVSTDSILTELVQRIVSQPLPFCLVGHSRGGAQAAVLAKRLCDRGIIPRKLFLLEPARAFYFRIPDEFKNIEVYGTWNGNDPVPHLPLAQQFPLQIIGHDEFNAFANHHLGAVAAALDAIGG